MTSKKFSPYAKAALKAADWFVNSQIIQKRPNWDANHGRYMYNVHVDSGTKCWGIGWTSARAIMVLITAYELTGDQKYKDSIELGFSYIKSLQNLDKRNPLTFGTFHEETPHSRYAFPRDAIEVADALLQWWKVTGDQDALERAELFFDWFYKNAVYAPKGFGKWLKGDVQFDKTPVRFKEPISCMMGSMTILAHAYKATGRARYRTLAKQLSDTMIKNYIRPDGAIGEEAKGTLGHHVDKSGLMFNDDGGCVSLFSTYDLTGQKKYLEAGLANADYYRDLKEPISMFSGIGSVANILVEAHRLTKDASYLKAAERYTKQLLKLQVKKGSKLVKGGFRGEDEGAKWYVKGAKNDDLITTRVTAYAALTLFKLDGSVKVRGYSPEL